MYAEGPECSGVFWTDCLEAEARPWRPPLVLEAFLRQEGCKPGWSPEALDGQALAWRVWRSGGSGGPDCRPGGPGGGPGGLGGAGLAGACSPFFCLFF